MQVYLRIPVESLTSVRNGFRRTTLLWVVPWHSMGLGKSLTCIAYLSALMRNPRVVHTSPKHSVVSYECRVQLAVRSKEMVQEGRTFT